MVTPSRIRLLACGDWPSSHLHCSWSASTFALSAELNHIVDELWERACARPGVQLFDGPLCRLEHFVCTDDGLHLHLSPNSYKYFIGTNAHHPEWGDRYGQHALVNPVGTSVLLRSGDGFLIAGQRNHSVALYPGFAHPFGGTLEPGQDNVPPDVIAELQRELTEEINLTPHDLSDVRAIALVEDQQLRQPELLCIATTALERAAIATRLDADEHHALWYIADNKTAVTEALAMGTAMTPVLSAMLLTYGRWRYGEAWLQSQLSDFYRDDRSH